MAPSTRSKQPRRQGVWWIGTIPHHSFTPFLPEFVSYIKGQLELAESGFLHWQVVVNLSEKKSLSFFSDTFGSGSHWELSRSRSANEYVWKCDTRVEGTQFELGSEQFNRNKPRDWDAIWDAAVRGDLMAIPASIRVQSYRTIRNISADFAKPLGMERSCFVYWGPTGTGKSRRAWDTAGLDAYPKDPNTKFWCGYRGQEHVIVDEFRGRIDISHLLRWLDRYPVIVEIKNSSVVLSAHSIWFTSNVDPRLWYPDLDPATLNALMRRLDVTHFNTIM